MTIGTTTEPLLQEPKLTFETVVQRYNAIHNSVYTFLDEQDAEKPLTTEQRQLLIQALRDLKQLLNDLKESSGFDISYVKAHIYFCAANIYAVLGKAKYAYQNYQDIVAMEIPSADQPIQTLKTVSEIRLRDFNAHDAENPILTADKLKLHNSQQVRRTYQSIYNTDLALALLGLLILLALSLGSFSFAAYILIANPLTGIGAASIITAATFFALLGAVCLIGTRFTFGHLNSIKKEPSSFYLFTHSNNQKATPNLIHPVLGHVSQPDNNKFEEQAMDNNSLIVTSNAPFESAPLLSPTASPQPSAPHQPSSN
jgi:hypothetical protein